MCRQGTSLLCAASERYWWHHRQAQQLWGGFESVCVVTVAGVSASHTVCRGSSLPCQWRWVLPGLPRLVPRLPHHTGRNLRPRGQRSFKDWKQHQKGEEPVANIQHLFVWRNWKHISPVVCGVISPCTDRYSLNLYFSPPNLFLREWLVTERLTNTFAHIKQDRQTSTQTSTYHIHKGKNVYGLIITWLQLPEEFIKCYYLWKTLTNSFQKFCFFVD